MTTHEPDRDDGADPATGDRVPAKAQRSRLRLALVGVVVVWTLLYNHLIKGQSLSRSFFGILDTISDDFVMGTTLTVGVGVGIVIVFSVTKLYTQVISNVRSFRLLEDLVYTDVRRGRWREFLSKLTRFESLPQPATSCPLRVSSVLVAVALIYVVSWIYVVLFSEALFFVSWSAGVDLDINKDSPELMLTGLPTLALAIPFSARVMAYLRYPYAQSYADFMPGAVFVLLLVGALGALFEGKQKVFLFEVFLNTEHPEYRTIFLRNGVFLAFIPVFFEAAFWLWELGRTPRSEREPPTVSGPDVASPADIPPG